MKFDYYSSLEERKVNGDCPDEINKHDLSSGFVDKCLVWSCSGSKKNKNEARLCYMKCVSDLKEVELPLDLKVEPDFSRLPHSSWFGIEVEFTLLSPWYSRDDRPFHVLDNPVRKDRVFGVPFMSAASWKGLLRWACRMQEGLYDHLEKHDMKMDGWKDPDWIVHLFGNERGEGEEFSQGALVFYPTWFSKIGFEVINPHRREKRAGTQPIYYEVVPPDINGILQLLYAPLPSVIENNDKVKPDEWIEKLIDSIASLLEIYGISAKRTAGWGITRIDNWKGFLKDSNVIEEKSVQVFKGEMKRCLNGHGEHQ